MDKMSYSFSELWFGPFLEVGRGKTKNPEKNVWINMKCFLLLQVCWSKCFKLFHFGRVIFSLWSCEVKFSATCIKLTLLALLLLTLKGPNLFWDRKRASVMWTKRPQKWGEFGAAEMDYLPGLSFPETAMNIGYSCNLLNDDMADVFLIEGSTSDDVLNELR